MKIFLKTGFVILFFLCSFLKSEAKGRDVTIFLKDSTEIKGELLAVRDSLVAVAVERIYADEDIAANPERVNIVKFGDIKLLRLENNQAIAIGFSFGTGIGVSYGSSGKFAKNLGMVVGGIYGGLLGGLIGMTAQKYTEDYTFDINTGQVYLPLKKENRSFATVVKLLRSDSLFEDTEPSSLHDVIDNLLKETK